MSLIKCTECGKEISDKASNCPNCGCPINSINPIIRTVPQGDIKTKPRKKKSSGAFTIILLLILAGLVLIFRKTNPFEGLNLNAKKNIISECIGVTDEESKIIDDVLNSCGIDEIENITHDTLLDNAHFDGETGYRIIMNNSIDNIILYLNTDKSVHRIRYADYDLYADGSQVATIQDYIVSIDEINKYQYLCQEKVKEVLKSPSTAKFPNYTKWGWKQEGNIFTVQGYVDAQNSFGAEVRSEFQFIIDMNTDTIQSFIFDGQELIG